jgi:uncharacterized protein (DUF1778 family)
MPRAVIHDNKRMNLRVRPEQKTLLARAAALENTDLTSFVTGAALRAAETVIEDAERVKLSERDSLLVLDLLENPPPANKRLRAAIAAMPKSK